MVRANLSPYRQLLGGVALTAVLVLCLLSSPSTLTDQLQLPYQGDGREYSGGVGGEAVQAARKATLRAECQDHLGQGVVSPMNPLFASKFYPGSLTLAPEDGLGWCRIGKVGTTAWSALFLLLRKIPLAKIQKAVQDLEAHDLLKETFPSKPAERQHMVRGEHGTQYFTFMVVRHPFVRLVSAYRDKLEKLTEYNVRYHMKDAVRMTERRSHNSSVADSPTFTEFVDYLIRTPPNLMDKHWAPYTKICLPCNVTYSAILKLETLQEDADWLFPKLGLAHLRGDWEQVAGVRGRVHGGPGGQGGLDSASLCSQYYSQVAKEDMVRLYLKYRVDFRMFGYDGQVQKYIDMGS